ncbi:hypothetical protein Godav_028323 [Gossypium davidsonii]|uniref:histidine kinase n=2 Tax=Gossypium TaxID=3633 RepID=A0A7J8S0I2_GOSDV|nr:hypothetical protein [Gossypium davidsonii]
MLNNDTRDRFMSDSYSEHQNSISAIEATSRFLLPLNTSALNLARTLSSALNGSELSFVTIEKKVIAPSLFIALSTIPSLSQISYVGLNGLMFSYYNDEDDQKLAVFCNTSFSSNWYSMLVNRDTGVLYGKAITLNATNRINETWFQEALNQTEGYFSLGKGWNDDQDSLFLTSVTMDGSGVISVGFPVQVVIDHFAALNFSGGYFHLATVDGDVIVQSELPNAEIIVNNNTVLIRASELDGSTIRSISNCSCEPVDGNRVSFHGRIMGEKYTFYCSTVEIAGVQAVYVLAYHKGGLVTIIEENTKLSSLLLILMFVSILVTFIIFIFFSIRAAKREMYLCAAFVKQMNATQQAERKSMFKTRTYLRANHDIRSSLAAISTLLDLCHADAHPHPELAANLVQIKSCNKDLLDILNSVLNIGKIEAGKMDLEEEEFNLAQLLENVVDVEYPSGIKKGVDVVLDPCDGSIGKLSLVRGDRVKLKQILFNLLRNAIKFTSDGHVSIRAVVKKRSFEKEIIASNGNLVSKCLSLLFCKKEDFEDMDALHRAEQNLNKMEFEFEVDDTGKGIPKDKQASIYEEFIQVKDTTIGEGRLEEEGCGLGLGIVQSIVRLMDGEIGIVDKEPGERGTCFRFTVMLMVCQPEPMLEPLEDSVNGGEPRCSISRSPAASSHVILYITGEERKRVLKKYMESLNIKVTLVKQGKCIHRLLEKIKCKLDYSYSNSSRRPESSSANLPAKSASSSSTAGTNDTFAGIKGGSDSSWGQYTKNNSRNCSTFILVVIESSLGNLSELCCAVANFRACIPDNLCKFVLLDNPVTRPRGGKEEDKLVSHFHERISEPLHGSRLIKVLHLLPEREEFQQNCLGTNRHRTSSSHPPLLEQVAINENMEMRIKKSLNEKTILKQVVINENIETMIIKKPNEKTILEQVVINKKTEKPLNEKTILLVEDSPLNRRITSESLKKLGAEVEVCTNGEEAVDKVCKMLKENNKRKAQPYDFILMDCQMPVMDGYEATRLIKREEKLYGVSIPVIALTADPLSEEATTGAGMNSYLIKPLNLDKLFEIIQTLSE